MAAAVPPAEPGPSAIAGFGLFACVAFPAGALVPVDAGVLNHSCDPNLGWSGTSLVALRDVADGEELTVDYATFRTDPDLAMYCHCETYRCRQIVEGGDWRIPQLQRRYAGHWHPVVQALIGNL